MNRKIVTRIWNWSSNQTKVWANFDVGGTEDVPIQIRKHIAKEIQKVIVERMVELEVEATEQGILYDVNTIDDGWFMSPEEVMVVVDETRKRLAEE